MNGAIASYAGVAAGEWGAIDKDFPLRIGFDPVRKQSVGIGTGTCYHVLAQTAVPMVDASLERRAVSVSARKWRTGIGGERRHIDSN